MGVAETHEIPRLHGKIDGVNTKKDCEEKITFWNRNHHCRLCGMVYPELCLLNASFANSQTRKWADKECYAYLLYFQTNFQNWESLWNDYVKLKRKDITKMSAKHEGIEMSAKE